MRNAVPIQGASLCILFTFGALFSASFILLEYHHMRQTQQDGENEVVKEFRRLIEERVSL